MGLPLGEEAVLASRVGDARSVVLPRWSCRADFAVQASRLLWSGWADAPASEPVIARALMTFG